MAHALVWKRRYGGLLASLLYAVTGLLAGLVTEAMLVATRYYALILTSLTVGQAVYDVSYLSHPSLPLALLAGLSTFAAYSLALLAPEARGASIDDLLEEYHNRAAGASLRSLSVKLVSTPMAVGAGAPVGLIGPTIYVGGSVGGLVGRLFEASFSLRRRLFIAGIAASVSWGLRTPLGAIFFALEIPYHRDLEGGDFALATTVGSLSSFAASVVLYGPPHLTAYFPGPHLLKYVAGVLLVAVLAGFVGRAFSGIYHLGISIGRGRWFLGASIASVLTASLLLANPLLAGSGSGIVSLITSNPSIPVAAALLILGLRAGASPLVSGVGVPGGLFGPGLAVGALIGYCVGYAAGISDPFALSVVGMASFYGAVSTAPIGMSLIVAESSGNYFLAVPSLAASLIAREVVGHDYLYINQKDRRLREELALARDLAEALKAMGVTGLKATCAGPGLPVMHVGHSSISRVAEHIDEVPAVVLVGNSVAGIVSEESFARHPLLGEDPMERVPIARCGDDLFHIVDLMVRQNSPRALLVGEGYYLVDAEYVLRRLTSATTKNQLW